MKELKTKKTTDVVVIDQAKIKKPVGRPRKIYKMVVPTARISGSNPKYITPNLPNREGVPLNVYDAPTGNCQLFSVCYFNNLEYFKQNIRLGKNEKLDLTPVLQAIRNSVYNKRLMFIDVKKSQESFVEDLFKKSEIKTKTPYRSSNNSKMITYIIDMKNY